MCTEFGNADALTKRKSSGVGVPLGEASSSLWMLEFLDSHFRSPFIDCATFKVHGNVLHAKIGATGSKDDKHRQRKPVILSI